MTEFTVTRGAVRQAIPRKVRFAMLRRDGFRCRYCGRRPPEVTLEPDHLLPVALGGTNALANLITACRDCNRGKGDYAEDEDGHEVRAPRGRNVWRIKKLGHVEYKRAEDMTALEWGVVALELDRADALLTLKRTWVARVWQARYDLEQAAI